MIKYRWYDDDEKGTTAALVEMGRKPWCWIGPFSESDFASTVTTSNPGTDESTMY